MTVRYCGVFQQVPKFEQIQKQLFDQLRGNKDTASALGLLDVKGNPMNDADSIEDAKQSYVAFVDLRGDGTKQIILQPPSSMCGQNCSFTIIEHSGPDWKVLGNLDSMTESITLVRPANGGFAHLEGALMEEASGVTRTTFCLKSNQNGSQR